MEDGIDILHFKMLTNQETVGTILAPMAPDVIMTMRCVCVWVGVGLRKSQMTESGDWYKIDNQYAKKKMIRMKLDM